jgi:hypothetical protein
MPITWRNVDAPTATGASRILDSAGRSFNKGIGGLTDLANQVTRTRTANQNNQNRINTDSALAGIGQLGSFDQLEAARQSGQFDPANLPEGTDLKAVRNALSNRGNVIDDTLNKEFQFDQRATKRDEFDTRTQMEGLIAKGDYAGAQALNAQLQNQAPGATAIKGGQRSALLQQRADTKFREDRQFQQGTELRQANAIQAQHDSDKALLDYKNSLVTAPKETVGAEGSKQNIEHVKRLGVAAPNQPWFGGIVPFGNEGKDAGGKEGMALVNKGVAALQTKYGRNVPSEVLGQIIDQTIGGMAGSNDTLIGMDNSYSPDDILNQVEDYMKANLKGDANIRNTASELEKNRKQLNINLERINKNRATRFPSL